MNVMRSCLWACWTPAVFGFAETIYRERAFGQLPGLAAALQHAGFQVSWGPATAQGSACSVVSQDPAAGAQAAPNTSVALRYVTGAGKDCTKKSD